MPTPLEDWASEARSLIGGGVASLEAVLSLLGRAPHNAAVELIGKLLALKERLSTTTGFVLPVSSLTEEKLRAWTEWASERLCFVCKLLEADKIDVEKAKGEAGRIGSWLTEMEFSANKAGEAGEFLVIQHPLTGIPERGQFDRKFLENLAALVVEHRETVLKMLLDIIIEKEGGGGGTSPPPRPIISFRK